LKRNLHITNGDSAADIIREFVAEDDVLPWRDPMHHGPFPLAKSLHELSRLRIDYLSSSAATPTPEALKNWSPTSEPHGFTERDAMLASSGEYEEVLLWFEHDLLDQLQLLQLLSWYSDQLNSKISLSLICIDQFEGIEQFRGIGQLNAVQMESLLAVRAPVHTETMTQAKQCWTAFQQSDPQALARLSLADQPAHSQLPFLRNALMRYCQEFPWLSDGLTRTERQILSLIDSGVVHAPQVFLQNMDLESYLYIGDWRTYSQIAQLCEMNHPLLECCGTNAFAHPPGKELSYEDFKAQELRLTRLGCEVLKGDVNALPLMERNEWLGGVYLNSERDLWCWDNQHQVFQCGIPAA